MSNPLAQENHLPLAARGWIAEHLPAPCRAVERVRQAARSTVLRLTTDAEAVYFKADHVLPPAEATILSRLSRAQPEHVVPVLALDADRGWSLTRDAGPAGLDDAPTADWCRIAKSLATVQLDSGLDADGWIAVGCRDRRGERLLHATENMIDDALPHLADDECGRLTALRPRIAETCGELMADGLAPRLVHQDVVPENVIAHGGRSLLIDWSDTVVGHPFFALDRLLDSCWSDADRKAAVIDAYLAGFTEFAPIADLRESFQRVLWLRVLYEGLRWHDEIAAVGPDSEQGKRLHADQLSGLRMVARRQS